MKNTTFTRATHLSIIWGVTLAVLTLIEWNSLDRNPVEHQILSPFIDRTMTVEVDEAPVDPLGAGSEEPDALLNYLVEFHFNGPLFIACFFIPVLLFHGLEALWNRLRNKPG